MFKLKNDSDGRVVNHNARLVTKGYIQRQSIDFDEVFAPFASLDTILVILAIATNRSWNTPCGCEISICERRLRRKSICHTTIRI